MIPKSCDVVVIGGGPAGSSSATQLVKKGYEVVLLDKVTHPRPIVGESMLPHVWHLFDLLGVTETIEKENFIEKCGGTVAWGGEIKQLFFSDFGYSRPGLHVERDRFDFLLLDHSRKLGVQIYENTTVKNVDFIESDKQVVSYSQGDQGGAGEITCRTVIDASGQSAVLSRQMKARKIDEDFRFVSIWGYFKNSKYVAADGVAYPFDKIREIPPTTFVASLSEWGWAWHIPMREVTSVGLIVPLEEMKKAKQTDGDIEAYFLQTCRETEYLNKLLEDAEYQEGSMDLIRDYSYVPGKIAGDGYFIVGDAAAFVDPIFSLGVVLAMYSGCLAAWACDRSLKDTRKTLTSQGIYKQQLGGWYELARSMALPGRKVEKDHAEIAKQFIGFQSDNEKRLLYAASLLTTRPENFEAISSARQVSDVLDSLKKIDSIKF